MSILELRRGPSTRANDPYRADDEIRTRDPHLGKVISPYALRCAFAEAQHLSCFFDLIATHGRSGAVTTARGQSADKAPLIASEQARSRARPIQSIVDVCLMLLALDVVAWACRDRGSPHDVVPGHLVAQTHDGPGQAGRPDSA